MNTPSDSAPKCHNHQCADKATIFIQMTENIGLCKKCYWAINLGLRLFKESFCPTCGKTDPQEEV